MSSDLPHAAKNSPLGRNSTFPKNYDPTLLCPLPRKRAIQAPAVEVSGIDRWDCYEVYWKGPDSLPRMACGILSYPSNTDFLIESKSLKLYLSSLHSEHFATEQDLSARITGDISSALKVAPEVLLWTTTAELSLSQPPTTHALEEYANRNEELTSCIFHAFKSICPVTSQPDFASIYVHATTGSINAQDFLAHLCEYHSHGAFHEECADTIFAWLLTQYDPQFLQLGCYFTRRGGIAINPLRWRADSKNCQDLHQIRFLRQ